MSLSNNIKEFLDDLKDNPAVYSIQEVINHLGSYYEEAKYMESLISLLESNTDMFDNKYKIGGDK